MRPKERSLYAKYNALLKARSGNLYLKVLRRLCTAHDLNSTWPELYKAIRLGDFSAMLSCVDAGSPTVVSDPNDVWNYFKHQQFVYLLKKYPFESELAAKPDPDVKALEKFVKSEQRCSDVNKLFSSVAEPAKYSFELEKMRHFIRYVLGSLSTDVFKECDFGPGASVGVHGKATHIGRKLSCEKLSITASALQYMPTALEHNFHLFEALERSGSSVHCLDYTRYLSIRQDRYRIVRHNKISFVPKVYNCSRTIAIEPTLNGYLQKGADIAMRRRLKRIGIDLSSQELNQEMARLGSLDDSPDGFVTIDLASASDSVSVGLVANLLPPDWYTYLDNIRSKWYDLNGELRFYSKFASMGNGFCFPLETLIFVAACHACGCGRPGKDFSVYGDDIIVRKKHSEKLIDLLDHIGFSVNPDKTFIEGPFRESCGEDWLFGVNVRHFTLDFRLDSISNLFKFINLSQRNTLCEEFFRTVKDLIVDQIPGDFRYLRPYPGNADTAITVSLDSFMSSPHALWSRALQTWSWKELHFAASNDREMRSVDGANSYLLPYVMLRGADSRHPFTLRRNTQAKTVRKYGAASCNWLPPPV